MNLVIGASGNLGSEICRLLRERSEKVRGLVRTTTDPARLEKLRSLGVETVIGDLRDPASLRAATAGIRTVLSTATVIASRQPDDSFDAVDDAGQRNLIDAARASSVDHFVFISMTGSMKVSTPITDAKRVVEAYLQASRLAWTILRPSIFMDIWLSPLVGFDHPNRKARILGDGRQRLSYIAMADVARFAAACVNNPAARNRIIELGGPDALTPLEAVATFERVTGDRYQVEHVPVDALRAQYEAAAHPTQKSFAGLMLGLTSDDVIPMDDTAREFGVELTSLEQAAPRLVGAPAAH